MKNKAKAINSNRIQVYAFTKSVVETCKKTKAFDVEKKYLIKCTFKENQTESKIKQQQIVHSITHDVLFY